MINNADIQGYSPIGSVLTLAFFGADLQAGGSSDDLLDALTAIGAPRGIRAHDAATAAAMQVPGPGSAAIDATDLMRLLQNGGPISIFRPVPGDVRGLAPRSPGLGPALDAGAVITLAAINMCLVPATTWMLFPGGGSTPAPSQATARIALDEALQHATGTLQRLDVASNRNNPRRKLARLSAAHAAIFPRRVPSTALELLRRCEQLEMLLMVAAGHETTAATAAEISAVHTALLPLRSAIADAQRSALALFQETLELSPASGNALSQLAQQDPRG